MAIIHSWLGVKEENLPVFSKSFYRWHIDRGHGIYHRPEVNQKAPAVLPRHDMIRYQVTYYN